MEKDINLSWLDEKVERVEKNNWIYRFICFVLMKKLTYRELLVMLQKINEKNLGLVESKKRSLLEIMKVYKYLNNRLPEGMEEFYESK